MFKRAIEEGLLDASRVFQAGMRGPLYGEADAEIPGSLGVEMIPWDELALLAPDAFGERARARVGGGKTFLSLDVDFVDPAFCPGTGTPEVGGPTSFEALKFLRSLTGIDFVGFDVVEVSPSYDNAGAVTGLFASTAMFEMLSLVALSLRDRG
jgi:agmatinase